MPITPTYPGVYIEELPSGVRTITGVPTSVAAFVGVAPRGPVNDPTVITSFADYERQFGTLSPDSLMSYSVFQYYQNGGSMAVIVRLAGTNAATASMDLENGVVLSARQPGAYGNRLRARVDLADLKSGDKEHYNLTVRDMSTGQQERFNFISTRSDEPARRLDRMLESSQLVMPKAGTNLTKVPTAIGSTVDPGQEFTDPSPPAGETDENRFVQGAGGSDGTFTDDAPYGIEADKSGLYALLKTDIFNMLVLPQITASADVSGGIRGKALKLCADRRAMLIVDPPLATDTLAEAVAGTKADDWIGGDEAAKNAAFYFPRIKAFDKDGRVQEYAPAGAVAGVYARTDVQRGVWKSPAGVDATLSGVVGLTVALTDLENGQLNPLGVNCLRSFPVIGRVVWGARTLRGADLLGDQWKYVPVRRLALFMEESLYRGTKWVVFEPNDEPLWSQIRLNVGAFMNNLFRQGAFQGKSPKEAYFVKCDKESTTQNDINLGIVNIIVGFAPLKPAEFVILKIQQMAGEINT